jgi:hypothetical protein
MRRTLPRIALLCTLPVIAGACAALKHMLPEETPKVTKSFYMGSITYTVDLDAQPYVSRMVSLQGRTASLQGDTGVDHQSDRLTLPLYRDADMNRDHHITVMEAEVAFRAYVRQFEDQLGPVVYQ